RRRSADPMARLGLHHDQGRAAEGSVMFNNISTVMAGPARSAEFRPSRSGGQGALLIGVPATSAGITKENQAMAPKVLISDKLSSAAVQIFKDRGVEVDLKPGLDKDQLAEIIGNYDGLAIRSATKVTPK